MLQISIRSERQLSHERQPRTCYGVSKQTSFRIHIRNRNHKLGIRSTAKAWARVWLLAQNQQTSFHKHHSHIRKLDSRKSSSRDQPWLLAWHQQTSFHKDHSCIHKLDSHRSSSKDQPWLLAGHQQTSFHRDHSRIRKLDRLSSRDPPWPLARNQQTSFHKDHSHIRKLDSHM